jgi:hypothetical protein
VKARARERERQEGKRKKKNLEMIWPSEGKGAQENPFAIWERQPAAKASLVENEARGLY